MSKPANAASVALIRDGKVLLIQRAYAPYQYLWTLPGGRLDPDETIEQCAIREIAEEVGLTVRQVNPVLVQELGETQQFRLAVFASLDFEGEVVASDEVKAYHWVTPAEFAQYRTTSRLGDVVAKAFAVVGQNC